MIATATVAMPASTVARRLPSISSAHRLATIGAMNGVSAVTTGEMITGITADGAMIVAGEMTTGVGIAKFKP